MKKYIYISLIATGISFGAQPKVMKKQISTNSSYDERIDLRSGDYGLVCQNELGSYNTDMENYLYSPTISVPEGVLVNSDFLFKGTFLDGDPFPNVDYFGLQVRTIPPTPNWFSDEGWAYVSNPYADTATVDIDFNEDGVIDDNDILVGDPYPPHYVYDGAPEFFNLFSSSYNDESPIDLSNFAGLDIQFRFWFHSDNDAPQGEGLFIDDFVASKIFISSISSTVARPK